MKLEPKYFIDLIRKSDRYIEAIYTEGGCYQFHLILKGIFPSAVPLINIKKDHVVSKIDHKLYDIRGVVTGEYFELSKDDFKLVRKWSFHRNKLISITDCPFCEEPICV